MAFKLGILGIDHGHIFGMLRNMLAEGCVVSDYWTDGPAVTERKFRETFPTLKKQDDRRVILDDPDVNWFLSLLCRLIEPLWQLKLWKLVRMSWLISQAVPP